MHGAFVDKRGYLTRRLWWSRTLPLLNLH